MMGEHCLVFSRLGLPGLRNRLDGIPWAAKRSGIIEIQIAQVSNLQISIECGGNHIDLFGDLAAPVPQDVRPSTRLVCRSAVSRRWISFAQG